MTTSELAIVAGVGLFAWYAFKQPAAGGGSVTLPGGTSIDWQWPRSTMGYSDGTDVPADGRPFINAAGRTVPGGGASAVYSRPIAPQLYALGGSPSGWNPSGSDLSYRGY